MSLFKVFALTISLAVLFFNSPAYAKQIAQEAISEYERSIFSAQEKNDCKNIISHMEALTSLTQEISPALYYFHGQCLYQNKQYDKSIPILENYFYLALNDDKYYSQARKIYKLSAQQSASKSSQIEAMAKPIPPSNKLNHIKTLTGIDFIQVKSGCFIMGTPLSELERVDDEIQHKVCLNKPFLLGKYEVTQGQWEAIMSKNPSHFKECGSRCPVENISGKDIQSFIKILQIKTGLNFRLPTEAEWEYAARAGTTTAFSFGNNINTSQVNYDGDHPYIGKATGLDRKAPIAVGSLPANPWGFHDMHGNVWELIQDLHGLDYYKNSPTNNPTGPTKGSFNVRRGGSWRFGARFCRSGYRGRFRPDSRSTLLGFRLALTL